MTTHYYSWQEMKINKGTVPSIPGSPSLQNVITVHQLVQKLLGERLDTQIGTGKLKMFYYVM